MRKYLRINYCDDAECMGEETGLKRFDKCISSIRRYIVKNVIQNYTGIIQSETRDAWHRVFSVELRMLISDANAKILTAELLKLDNRRDPKKGQFVVSLMDENGKIESNSESDPDEEKKKKNPAKDLHLLVAQPFANLSFDFYKDWMR